MEFLDISVQKFFAELYQNKKQNIHFIGFEEPKPKDKEERKKTSLMYGTWESLKKTMYNVNTNGYGIYFQPNSTEGLYVTNENVKKAYSFFIDIDNGLLPEYFPVEPSAILSRNPFKHHIYWFLEEPITNLEEWTAVQKILIKFYGSDVQIHNSSRWMRIPNSMNLKEQPEKMGFLKFEPENRTTIEKMALAHTDPEKLKKAIKSKLKKIFPKHKLKDGDGRNQYMVQAAMALGDYGITNKTILIDWLNYCNDTFLEDKYTPQEIENVSTAQKSRKNKDGSSVIEDQIRKQAQIQHVKEKLKNWYFVASLNYMVDSENPLKSYLKESFNTLYSNISGERDTRGFMAQHGILNSVHGVCYEPAHGRFITDDNGLTFINMYSPPTLIEKSGDPVWFLDHVSFIMNGEEKIINHFLDYFAYMVQRPDDRINHAILITGGKGIGKSVFNDIFKQIFGEHNSSEPSDEDIEDQFNSWAKNCHFCFIHELMKADKRQFAHSVKSKITDPYISIREMYKGAYKLKNHMQIMAASNHDVPLHLEKEDRRWLIIKSYAKKKSGEYYEELYKNIKENTGQVLKFLKERDISKFKPKEAPPVTKAKLFLLDQSRSDFEVWLDEQLEDKPAPFFDKDFLCPNDLLNIDNDDIFPRKFKNKMITINYITRLLIEAGYEKIEDKIKIDGKSKRIIIINQVEKYKKMIENGEFGALNSEIRMNLSGFDEKIRELNSEFCSKNVENIDISGAIV